MLVCIFLIVALRMPVCLFTASVVCVCVALQGQAGEEPGSDEMQDVERIPSLCELKLDAPSFALVRRSCLLVMGPLRCLPLCTLMYLESCSCDRGLRVCCVWLR